MREVVDVLGSWLLSILDGQRYLYKPEQTSAVKGLIERLWRRGDWQGVGQGFDDNAQSLLRTIQLGRQHDG
ncbi:MAG: hypothetical protein V5B35_11685 [Candidatus Accumulibacter necessarius]|uniref:hypothetical protein n=1 Tax=Candidatus Accumulibacter necessarius TaxID=2954386 RepID=UPI002FC39F20